MNNKPQFWYAFKGLAQIRNQMISELITRFYAFNAYYYAFNDKTFVTQVILNGISNADTIYTDPVYGMDTSQKLFLWFQAAPFITSSQQAGTYSKLQQHFSLTDANMDQIFSVTSTIFMVYQYVHYQIKTYYLFTTDTFSSEQMETLFQQQWGSLELL